MSKRTEFLIPQLLLTYLKIVKMMKPILGSQSFAILIKQKIDWEKGDHHGASGFQTFLASEEFVLRVNVHRWSLILQKAAFAM